MFYSKNKIIIIYEYQKAALWTTVLFLLVKQHFNGKLYLIISNSFPGEFETFTYIQMTDYSWTFFGNV